MRQDMADGEPPIPIRERLLKERHALLDLSARNRLLNVPLRTRNNRAIEIVDEKAAEVFRTLDDGKVMAFLPGAQLSDPDKAELEPGDTETGGIPQPGDEAVDGKGRAARHTDLKLQTRLTSEGLQKRLFDVWYDAETLEQEQGVNILYLAFGLLRWYDSDAADTPRHAPLALLPVRLERSSAADRFRLKSRDEAISVNLTLQAKMKSEFGLVIPDFPETADNDDGIDLDAYADAVGHVISGQKRWEVQPDAMVLGFFSFAKFLMYRDLDPENWPDSDGIEDNDLITAILRDGFPESPPLVGDHERIDDKLLPVSQHHVVDADSSQTVAIAEVVAGRTLVIKGPPGTGKSQTITNIIAGAVAAGKKVLFVAEKMAALDVVHRRLKAAGLGPLTLELHSNKVSKRAVLEELKRTREAAARTARGDQTVIQKLSDAQSALNGFADRLHNALSPSGLTPQQILGRLAAWDAADQPGRDYALIGADAWTLQDVADRHAIAEEIGERLVGLGNPAEHPWRGVRADAFDPTERDQLVRDIVKARDALTDALRQAAIATEVFEAPSTETIVDLKRSFAWLQLTPLPKDADRAALAEDAWRNIKGLKGLIDTGLSLTRLRNDTWPRVTDAGRDADYDAIRTDVVTKSQAMLRFLDGGYKRNIALLRSYLKVPLPATMDERLKLIDQIIRLQKTEADFAAASPLSSAFGHLWQGAESDWDALANVLGWRQSHRLPGTVWPRVAAVSDTDVARADGARQAIFAALNTLQAALDDITGKLDLDLTRAFGSVDRDVIEIDNLATRFDAWLGNMEGLSRFIAFASRGRALTALGAGAIVDAVHDGMLDAKSVVPAFDGAYSNVLRTALFAGWPDLKAFDGDSQDRRVAEFRQLDLARIDLAKEQIAAKASDDRPQGNAGIGPLGVLNAELAKKRAHKPLRVLLDQAGPVIQDLKPVFMMSPLSVAQFLKPGSISFDLLVMDEASQIEPVDALGAIARARQVAVVGDERQLPPTAFFKKLTGEDETEEDDGVTIAARDAESILDLCLAKGAPHRMLSWHYRSKHQSLIAVSNREFYDNRLFIVPSPYDAMAGMGLKFHWLKDTVYDRGGERINAQEAKIVAEAVIAHARQTPDQSLGVATFSVAQRQCVLKELELLRRAHPELEDFFATERPEPFFVKNLENIQGDERDVIFISIGYGKTAQGALAHAFGPLSGDGGERRLNVLISRAKLRCEVFCNFKGEDIDPERTTARGVLALKLFLTFAETGRFSAIDGEESPHDSAFEDQVATRLRGLGYDIKTQIGASGFRVDLGVADRDVPGRFVLGIECDGAQYHSSRSARDRDRLRQQVLESHGWIIHRIWSADWYLRPQEELKKLEMAIAAAKAEWAERDTEATQPETAVPLRFDFEQTPQGEAIAPVLHSKAEPPEKLYYAEAVFAVNSRVEPQDAAPNDLADATLKIVEQEGPIHADEIVARVRTLWGSARTSPRLKSAVADAMTRNAARGVVIEDGGFYTLPDRDAVVRDRSRVASAGLRKPDMLPPAEVTAAVLNVVGDNYGATRVQLVPAVARAFGFNTTSSGLRARIEDSVIQLLNDGALAQKGDLLILP